MSSDAVVLLNACTGLSIKAEENEKGVVDMCRRLQMKERPENVKENLNYSATI